MPYRIVKTTGERPYKILRSDLGTVVGSSKTRAAAEASIRARYMGKHNPEAMRWRGRQRGGAPL